jgi:spore maturation protein SpmA
MSNIMQQDQVIFLKAVKYSAIALSALTVAGIATLMFISRDKDEDIAGIVAPALLITIISTVIAIVAAILQKRSIDRDGGVRSFTKEK